MILVYTDSGIEPKIEYKEINGTITIGRSPKNNIVLNNPHISSFHGVISFEGGKYIYRDLKSTNGSSILREGERRIIGEKSNWEVVIKNNDKLFLGDARVPVVLSIKIEDSSLEEIKGEGTIIASKPIESADDLRIELEKDENALAILYKLSKDLHKELEITKILEIVAEAILKVFNNATHITIFLKENDEIIPLISKEKDSSTLSKTDPIKISKTLVDYILKKKSGILLQDAIQDLGGGDTLVQAKIRSTICVPLWMQEELIGIIELDNRYKSGVFKERDLNILIVYGNHLSTVIENIHLHQQLKIAQEKLKGENLYLKKIQNKYYLNEIEGMIGISPNMQNIFKELENITKTSTTVLILGETGTGKEPLAHAIHKMGDRRNEPFIAISCTDLTETLLESELFGHKKGAFSEAKENKKGLLEISDGGTLFLDEIGDAPKSLQGKLLRFLETGEIRPVGDTQFKKVNVRIITATNKDLKKEVEKGNFREDLYYRLNVFPIKLPPLRERKEDIPLLAEHFLKKFVKEMNKKASSFTKEALEILTNYGYPGNIRELKNIIERIVVRIPYECEVISKEFIPEEIYKKEDRDEKSHSKDNLTLSDYMEKSKKEIILNCLTKNRWNITLTAKQLGISRVGLQNMVKELGLKRPES